MTPHDRLQQIKARAEAATDGEWWHWTFDGTPEERAIKCAEMLRKIPGARLHGVAVTNSGPDLTLITAVTGDGPDGSANADFIANARKDLPDMVAFTEAILERCESYAAIGGMTPGSIHPAFLEAYAGIARELTALADQHLGDTR